LVKITAYIIGNTKKVALIFVIVIVSISYGLFFYLQNNTENNVRNSLFEQQKQQQIDSTESLSRHVGSSMDSIMARLQAVSNSDLLQQGDSSSNKTKKLLQETYTQINTITPIDRLLILDKDDIVIVDVTTEREESVRGIDFSYRDWVNQTKSTRTAVFSNGFDGIDGKYNIAVSYPIINKISGEYLGQVGTLIPTIPFFEHYGNIYDIKSQYLAVLDRNSVELTHPIKSFIGKPFFGSQIQESTGQNKILNNYVQNVMSGKAAFEIYEFENGQRLNTGHPVFLAGKPTYFVFTLTPTSAIFSSINEVISSDRIGEFSLLVGTTTAVVVLILFLIKWSNNLNDEVRRRTREISDYSKQLSIANEQLKIHDKTQREFINLAAHELRTPIQPILSLTEVLLLKKGNIEEYRKYLDMVIKNARRLKQLTEDILDVTRMESHTLSLKKEQFDINDIINDVVLGFRSQIEGDNKGGNQTKILFEPKEDITFIEADKGRIYQVVSNLLGNAVKFADSEGSVSITSEKKDNQAIVTVKDNGRGIGSEMMPRLFSKFASKSFTGPGLGLYISKNIVEAHGGKIWAHNNYDGKGATLTFSIPLIKEEEQHQKQQRLTDRQKTNNGTSDDEEYE
jgi:signal transduction histidine kinase